jgi:ferredoxin, 2Fe-2S
MGRVTYLSHTGDRRTIELDEGESLMTGALENQVPGIDGDCGGHAACGTCHVHVHPDWTAKAGPATDVERDMLQFADGAGEDSRLACQIRMRDELDGIVVLLPQSQH